MALVAGFWGMVGGSALLLGAGIAYLVQLPQRLIAAIMAIGSGVLISAVAFDLMDEAYKRGGFDSTALGFVGGALAYTLANVAVSRAGARHRKRSGSNPDRSQPSADSGSGLAIAIGALLDGIPESVVIGVSLLEGGGVSLVTVAAVFLSNVPEGLSSAAGMKRAGHGPGYIFGVWGGIAVLSGLAALVGNVTLADATPDVIAATTAIAAGAILAMLVDTMIPEATEETHEFSGLITVAGFLLAFILSKMGG
ncbi:ZIP family zinc transporter [Novosphingobium chloroacetimidivorans]|uniref:ZIP family zinc transporter n=1 Tax=Novosphingobium chloroacetimidivorans TaxID=1428314 RepID=A0A7W7KC35_9SPHN|nr:ZIP family zinc transporter [Novosphingobium chloroacetimidivorans]MBB4860080.1 ZIP family zinc transporter [Novosphingobium chloroacetimidivorans]